MDTTRTNCNKSLREIDKLMTYAKKAARNAFFKWGLAEDDTFQEIMLNLWFKRDLVNEADNPIAFARHQMRNVIGHMVEDRFWRKGNDVTDYLGDGFDPAADIGIDLADLVDATRVYNNLTVVQRFVFVRKYIQGYSAKEVASMLGKSPQTVANISREIEGAFGVDGRKRARRDSNKYTIENNMGEVVDVCRKELTRLLGSSGGASDLINGKNAQAKGWRIVRVNHG